MGFVGDSVNSIPTQSYYYHADHLGSSSQITDGTGQLVQHLEYLPFGEVFLDRSSSSLTWNTPYKFSGKELDPATGLYYFGARYYDPRTGVWLGVDPLAKKYPSTSPYMYCLGNPVILIDKWGEKPIPGPFTNRIHKSGSSMFAYRYTTNQRKALSVYNGLSSFTPIGSGQNIVNDFASLNTGAIGTNIGSGITYLFGGFCNLIADEVPENADFFLKLGGGAKVLAKSINKTATVVNIINTLDDGPTSQEVIEANVFNFVSKKYTDVNINITNEGLLEYTGNGNSEHFSNVLNAVYNTFSEMTADFDLTTEAGRSGAYKYIKENINEFNNSIKTQINDSFE